MVFLTLQNLKNTFFDVTQVFNEFKYGVVDTLDILYLGIESNKLEMQLKHYTCVLSF